METTITTAPGIDAIITQIQSTNQLLELVIFIIILISIPTLINFINKLF